MENKDLRVVVLVGGKGSRLQKVVNDRPKALADIHGRPFLHYLLDDLSRQGIRRVTLCTGFKAEQIRNVMGERYGDIGVSYSHEAAPLGTGGAVLKAIALFRDDPFIVMNGDSFNRCSLQLFIDFAIRKDDGLSMLLASVDDVFRYGAVCIGNDGKVVGFSEKGQRGPGLVNSGVYFFRKSWLQSAGITHTVSSLEKDILPKLVEKGMYGYVSKGGFIDIGTEESYAAAASFFTHIE